MSSEDHISKALSTSQPTVILGALLITVHEYLPSVAITLAHYLPGTLDLLAAGHIAVAIGIAILVMQVNRSAGGCVLTISLATLTWIIDPFGKAPGDFVVARFFLACVTGASILWLMAHTVVGAIPSRHVVRRIRNDASPQANIINTNSTGKATSKYNNLNNGYGLAGLAAGAAGITHLSHAAHAASIDDLSSQTNWNDNPYDSTETPDFVDSGPIFNVDGTPMIPGTMMDLHGHSYGMTSNDTFDSFHDSFGSSMSDESLDIGHSSMDSFGGSSFGSLD